MRGSVSVSVSVSMSMSGSDAGRPNLPMMSGLGAGRASVLSNELGSSSSSRATARGRRGGTTFVKYNSPASAGASGGVWSWSCDVPEPEATGPKMPLPNAFSRQSRASASPSSSSSSSCVVSALTVPGVSARLTASQYARTWRSWSSRRDCRDCCSARARGACCSCTSCAASGVAGGRAPSAGRRQAVSGKECESRQAMGPQALCASIVRCTAFEIRAGSPGRACGVRGRVETTKSGLCPPRPARCDGRRPAALTTAVARVKLGTRLTRLLVRPRRVYLQCMRSALLDVRGDDSNRSAAEEPRRTRAGKLRCKYATPEPRSSSLFHYLEL
jgi:hypothetical protein